MKFLEQKKKVMLFGTFDGIHDGHRHLLKNAKKEGEILIVVVARNEHVLKLKNHAPRLDEKTRIALLKKEKVAEKVVLSDEKLSSWKIIEKHKPDIVALGYDQKELGDALKKIRKKFPFPFHMRTIQAHQPEKFHSSILLNKREEE